MDELAARMVLLEQQLTNANIGIADATGRAQAAETAAAAAGVRASSPTAPTRSYTSTSLVDTRPRGKPRNFDGKEGSWKGFRFSLMSYAGAVDSRLPSAMSTAVSTAEDSLRNATQTEEMRALSTQLYYMLALSIDNDTGAIMKVEHAGAAEGFIAWERPCETFEPETASRTAALLQEVLSYVFDQADIISSFIRKRLKELNEQLWARMARVVRRGAAQAATGSSDGSSDEDMPPPEGVVCRCRCGCSSYSERFFTCNECHHVIANDNCSCIIVIVPIDDEPCLCHVCHDESMASLGTAVSVPVSGGCLCEQVDSRRVHRGAGRCSGRCPRSSSTSTEESKSWSCR